LLVFVNGYMIDILLPFAMYLVLGVADQKVLCTRVTRDLAVFGIGAITETLQYFGVAIFGRTFDPLDYLMFGIGIVLAALFEKMVLSRIATESPARSNAGVRRAGGIQPSTPSLHTTAPSARREEQDRETV
jgi:hypothetical protein